MRLLLIYEAASPGLGDSFLDDVQQQLIQVVMAKKETYTVDPDLERIAAGLRESESVDSHTVRSLCPCHVGWEVFERHVGVVIRRLKDGSRESRAHALHVFEDAIQMQLAEEFRYYHQSGEERIGEKRASARFRSIAERVEARRDSKLRKRKRGHREASGAA